MARVAYSASKRQFIQDWQSNIFMTKMIAGAYANRIGGSPSEKRSWESNAAKVVSLLELAHVPDDVHVAFEYKSPLAGRVDCMLFAHGADGKKHNRSVFDVDNGGSYSIIVVAKLLSVLVGRSPRDRRPCAERLARGASPTRRRTDVNPVQHNKKYSSKKRFDEDGNWEHEKIVLIPLNKEFSEIEIDGNDENEFQVIGEFVGVVK